MTSDLASHGTNGLLSETPLLSLLPPPPHNKPLTLRCSPFAHFHFEVMSSQNTESTTLSPAASKLATRLMVLANRMMLAMERMPAAGTRSREDFLTGMWADIVSSA